MKHDDQQFLSAMMDGEWQGLDVRRAIADVSGDEALRAKWSRYHLARHAMQHESVRPVGSLAAAIAAAVAEEPTYSNVTAIDAVGARAGTPDAAPGRIEAEESVAGEAALAASVAAAGGSLATGTHGAAVPIATLPRAGGVRTFAAGFGLAASVAVVTALGLNALDGDAPAGVDAGSVRVASSEPVRPSPAPDPFSRQVPGAPLPNVELVANTANPGAYWSDAGSRERRAGSEERLNMYLSQHIENSPTAERQGMLPYSRLVGYDERASER